MTDLITGCVLFKGALSSTGYGQVKRNGKQHGAHRLAFEDTWGIPIPQGKIIMHLCDNRACVNPLHLRLGTQADNMRDRDRKGRGVTHYKDRTHCKGGHEFTIENTHIGHKGRRNCRACARIRDAARRRTKGYAGD